MAPTPRDRTGPGDEDELETGYSRAFVVRCLARTGLIVERYASSRQLRIRATASDGKQADVPPGLLTVSQVSALASALGLTLQDLIEMR